MKLIESGIFKISDLMEQVMLLLAEKYKFPTNIVEFSSLDCYIKTLNDNLFVYLEYPYVDKFYRSSYYSYYSTKHSTYQRDCLRLSFFDIDIREEHFRKPDLLKELQDNFLGFLIIRPTVSNIIGRSMLSPKALKTNSFSCCLVETEIMVNGAKLSAWAFPHSAQDSETITCAETTIWSVMEYFGNKYAEYKPILPATINSVLTGFSFQRQTPSRGLKAEQISYALREFDFGTRLYAKETYGDNEFKRLFYYYIESGIPFIAALSNEQIAHAITIIGHENIDSSLILSQNSSQKFETTNRAIDIIDTADIPKRYVAIDDNFPPFQLAEFETPTAYYDDPDFDDCKIEGIIVPLYPKIYLEPLEARETVFNILCNEILGIETDQQIVLRLFLTSSRSFKHNIAFNNSVDELLKEFILHLTMPKFIWVAELSNKIVYSKGNANGLIILDATEPNRNLIDTLLFIAYPDKFIFTEERTFSVIQHQIKDFSIYTNNLKRNF